VAKMEEKISPRCRRKRIKSREGSAGAAGPADGQGKYPLRKTAKNYCGGEFTVKQVVAGRKAANGKIMKRPCSRNPQKEGPGTWEEGHRRRRALRKEEKPAKKEKRRENHPSPRIKELKNTIFGRERTRSRYFKGAARKKAPAKQTERNSRAQERNIETPTGTIRNARRSRPWGKNAKGLRENMGRFGKKMVNSGKRGT